MFVPMTKKLLLGITLAVSFAVLFFAPLGIADAMGDFLDIKKAKVSANDNKLKEAVIETFGKIPTKGAAIGYAVGTTEFDPSTGGTLIVATTHPGVLDSEEQKGNINSPAWHNHYVEVGGVAACASEVGVLDISHESPGKVSVDGKKIKIRDVPTGTIDTHFGLAPNSLNQFTTGDPIQAVASFELIPMFGAEGLEAVCVNVVELFAIT
jgi:hypothetical protein